MGNEFYDVLTMKMERNLYYNWTVSFMETKNYQNQQEKQHKIQLAYTNIVSKQTQENLRVINKSYFSNSEKNFLL